eukprot:TRINITY_DN1074_c0_g1_i1.p1 TRINITY_DN1074_c0_g1~~TRINITY_DN1074_c0_g1_i1.p1  ORF type:complete len:541 (-),score=87.36 TRINITY_DN1074_c0_g1_i1:23-1645(-)
MNGCLVYNSGKERLRGLEDGWILDRKEDVSDLQWNAWRQSFPLLFVFLSFFVAISQLLRYLLSQYTVANSSTNNNTETDTNKYGHNSSSSKSLSFQISPNTNKKIRMIYYVAMGLLMTGVMHTWGAIWLWVVLGLNYGIAKTLKRDKLMPVVTWMFNITVVFSNYYFGGYKFRWIHESLSFIDYRYEREEQPLLHWETYFKITMLRLISHNFDYYWAITRTASSTSSVDLKKCSEYTRRQETPLRESDYDAVSYLAHALYPPLYLAGPIVSFNAFVSQVISPQDTYSIKEIAVLLIRVVLYTIGLEIFLHFCYYHAVLTFGAWRRLPPIEVAITGYLVLNFMYTKFLIIWRFFRAMALFDGIESPENMNRCVNNNFTFVGFWRSWHGSFNKWTIRYMYVPLGGWKTRTYSLWLIFFFIGLWHDLWWKWVAWALLNCLFFSLEIIIMTLAASERFEKVWAHRYSRYLVGAVGSLNIFLLMISNLAILLGFEDSFKFLSRAFLSEEAGIGVFFYAWFWLFVGVIFMQEIRAGEARMSQAKKF